MKPIHYAFILFFISLTFPSIAKDVLERKNIQEQMMKIKTKSEKLDTNGDGWLSDQETAPGKQKMGMLYGAIQKKVDLNHDGKISVEEYIKAQEQQLRAADTNQDGWIDVNEGKAQKRKLIGELLKSS